jgi:hypothetical protein
MFSCTGSAGHCCEARSINVGFVGLHRRSWRQVCLYIVVTGACSTRNKTSQANLFTLRSVHTSGGRRWWGPEGGGTRHNVERRNPTDTRTAYILQGFPSEHSKCPSGTPYVQQACGSTGEAVKQTSGTCRNAKHPEPKTRKAVKAS